jgi:hypothetical protein
VCIPWVIWPPLTKKAGFETGGYVLVRWVIFIAPDFAADGKKGSGAESLTRINLVESLEGKSSGCPICSKTYIQSWEVDR